MTGKLDSARLALALAPAGALFCLLMLHGQTLMPDDVSARLTDLDPSRGAAHWWNYQNNGRPLAGALYAGLRALGIPYFGLIALWGGMLCAALALCAAGALRRLQLPSAWFPLFFGAVALHGYFADPCHFPSTWLTFAVALGGAGAALFAIELPGWRGAALSALGVLVALTSYQPFAFIVVFVGALGLVQSQRLTPTVRLGAAFLAAILAYAAVLAIVPAGRGEGAAAVGGNLDGYMRQVWAPFLAPGGLARLFPLHERLIYGASILGVLALAVVALVKKPSPMAGLAVAGLLVAILLSPGAYNLLGGTFWPTPRSMSPVIFFHVGAAALLAQLVLPRAPWLPAAAIALLSASLLNQGQFVARNIRQTQADRELALDILRDIRSMEHSLAQPKLAVQSTWRAMRIEPPGYMDAGMSAFAQPWSKVAIFQLHSGVPFEKAALPDGACPERVDGDYELRVVDGIFVVCMP